MNHPFSHLTNIARHDLTELFILLGDSSLPERSHQLRLSKTEHDDNNDYPNNPSTTEPLDNDSTPAIRNRHR